MPAPARMTMRGLALSSTAASAEESTGGARSSGRRQQAGDCRGRIPAVPGRMAKPQRPPRNITAEQSTTASWKIIGAAQIAEHKLCSPQGQGG